MNSSSCVTEFACVDGQKELFSFEVYEQKAVVQHVFFPEDGLAKEDCHDGGKIPTGKMERVG